MRFEAFVVATIIGTVATSCAERECKLDHTASYLVHYHERSGTCGPIQDSIITGSGAAAAAANCTLFYANESEDKCSSESSSSCVLPSGITLGAVTELEVVDDDGSKLEGTIDATIADTATGTVLCASSYDVTYTRL